MWETFFKYFFSFQNNNNLKITLSSVQQEDTAAVKSRKLRTSQSLDRIYFWHLKNFLFPTVGFSANFIFSGVYNSLSYQTVKCSAGYMDNYSCGYLDSGIDKALTVSKYLPFLILIHPCRPLLKCNIFHIEAESLKM